MSQSYPYNQPDQAYPLNQLYQLLVNYVNQQVSSVSVSTISCTPQYVQATWQVCLAPPAQLAGWLATNQLTVDQAAAYLSNWWQTQAGQYVYAQQLNNDYYALPTLLGTAPPPLLPWIDLINDNNMSLQAISGLFASQYIAYTTYMNFMGSGLPLAVNVTNWAGAIEYAPSSYVFPYIPNYISTLGASNVNVTNLAMVISNPVIDANTAAQIISYPTINVTGMTMIVTNPAVDATQMALAISQVPVVGNITTMAMVIINPAVNLTTAVYILSNASMSLTSAAFLFSQPTVNYTTAAQIVTSNAMNLTTAAYIFSNAAMNYSSAGLIISNPAVNLTNAQTIFNNVLNLNWSGVVYMLNAAYPNYTTMGAVAVNPSVNITYMVYVVNSPAINYTNVAPIITASTVNQTTAVYILSNPAINYTNVAPIITAPAANYTTAGYLFMNTNMSPATIYNILSNANANAVSAQQEYYAWASLAVTYAQENEFINVVTYNQPAVTLSANVSATWTLFYSSLQLAGYTLTMGTTGRPSVIVTYSIQMSGGAIVQNPTGAPGGISPAGGGTGGGGGGDLVIIAVTGILDGTISAEGAIGLQGASPSGVTSGSNGNPGYNGYLIIIEGIVYTASAGGSGGKGTNCTAGSGGGGGGGYSGGSGGGFTTSAGSSGGSGGSATTLNYSTRWSYVYTMLQFLGDEWQRYVLGRTLSTYVGATYLAGYGAGGGGGGIYQADSSAGGGGGMGGQIVIYMHNLYAPTTNQIIAMGGTGGPANLCGCGGGGGAGGLVYILTHNLIAFSGTINVQGGVGMTGVKDSAGSGGTANTYAIFVV